MVKHSVFIVNTSQLPFHYSDDENHFSAIVFFFGQHVTILFLYAALYLYALKLVSINLI